MARTVVVSLVYNRFPQIIARLPQAALEVVEETLDDIDTTVQTGMAAGGRGRIYVRRGRTHQASAPGDMPARDLGNLAGSLQKEISRREHKGYYYTTVEYAPYLEFGTSRGIAPRPFMAPAAEQARAAFLRRMRRLESRLT